MENVKAIVKISDLKDGGEIIHQTPGGVELTYSINTLRSLVAVRDKDPALSDRDVCMFANAAVEWQANPYLEEIWLVAIKGKWRPIVAAKTKLRRAHECAGFGGLTTGWITKDGKRHEGGKECEALPDNIIGAWCEIHRGKEIPLWHEVFLKEYTSGQRPLTMLQKTVRDQAVRLKYPELMGGAYTENEMAYDNQPEPAYTPETPKRADRKKIASVDIKQQIMDCVNLFEKSMSIELSAGNLIHFFCEFAAMQFGGTAGDYQDNNGMLDEIKLDAEKIAELSRILETGIPDEIIKMMPPALGEDDESAKIAEEFEDRVIKDKYICSNPKCGITFNEPKENGLCPKCLTDKIEEIE